MTYAPIALFVYNRLDHTTRTVNALKKATGAKQTELYIFSDGPRIGQEQSVQRLRNYLKTVSGFKKITIFESKKNKGLANSIIAGVSKVVKKYGRIIVMEDDLIVRKDFLSYMNKGLDTYESRPDAYEIAGHISEHMVIPTSYKKDYFLNMRPTSWGWATWKDRWEQVDWDVKSWSSFKKDSFAKKQFSRSGDDALHLLKLQQKGLVSSWAIRWHYAIFQKKGWAISPTESLVINIGEDGSGEHCIPGQEKEILFTPVRKWAFDKHIEPEGELLFIFEQIHKWNFFQKTLFSTLTFIGYYSWRKKAIPKWLITQFFWIKNKMIRSN